jgi:glycosyltransferase involved in cell wall biosynthesis
MTLLEDHNVDSPAAAISRNCRSVGAKGDAGLSDVTARPMVLHVRVVTGHGGGPEKTILNSPRFLQRLGYESKLAYLHPPDDPGFTAIQDRGRALDAEVISIPDRGALDLSVVWQLARLCRRLRVAVWHGHDYKSNLIGILIRPFWRMKLVTTLHGWTNLSGRAPLYVQIDKRCLKYYRAAICVSEDLVEDCLACQVSPSRCYLINNAIDTEDYRRTLTIVEAKRAIGAPLDQFLVAAVGRLSPEKGYDALIRAVVALRRSGRPIALWIAGDGNAAAQLSHLIAELNAGDYVRLLGHSADPRGLYQAADAFALSSIREGLPNVVLEAMALQTPVVATRIAGVPKLIADGHEGLLVPPGDADALAAAINRLFEDPGLRTRLAHAGRATVEERFSFARRMEKVVAVYDAVLGRPARQSADTCFGPVKLSNRRNQ